MNISKNAIFLALGCIGAQAFAEGSHAKVARDQPPVESTADCCLSRLNEIDSFSLVAR